MQAIKGFFATYLLHIASGVIVGLVVYCTILNFQVLRRDVTIARQQTSMAGKDAAIRSCNAATDALRRQSERMRAEQEQALRAAREANERQGSTIESLRRGSVTPRTGACSISETLRNAQGL